MSGGTGAGWRSTAGWGAYLACSWTWCIGMFLPVLLVRDFGPWGFVVFAVPNVLGAGAMGWVLTRERSERLVAAHGAAVRVFSSVTIAFQVYFAFWLAGGVPLGPLGDVAPSAVRGLAVLALVVAAYGRPRLLPGVVVLLISLGALGAYAGTDGVTWPSIFEGRAGGQARPAVEAVPLALVCVLGFVLCPYLDGTFHRAAQESGAPRGAFTIGFGAVFPWMIVGTLVYAPRGMGGEAAVSAAFAWLAVLHIGVQLAFTIHEHVRAGLALEERHGRVPLRAPAAAVAVAMVLLGLTEWGTTRWLGVSAGEVVYRLFMAFYGLVFPAYVWLCVIPPRGRALAEPGRGVIRPWLLACGVAAPFYWMGFIERQTWFLVPGVGVVVLARVLVGRAWGAVPAGR